MQKPLHSKRRLDKRKDVPQVLGTSIKASKLWPDAAAGKTTSVKVRAFISCAPVYAAVTTTWSIVSDALISSFAKGAETALQTKLKAFSLSYVEV